jgi:hypothetical protein
MLELLDNNDTRQSIPETETNELLDKNDTRLSISASHKAEHHTR